MRLFLAFAVTFSFLAGQACGNGVRVFQPLLTEEGVEFMSRMIVRCDAETAEEVAGTSADCGPRQCVESAKSEPDDAGTATARADASRPPAPVEIVRTPSSLVALNGIAATTPAPSRPVLQVRRE